MECTSEKEEHAKETPGDKNMEVKLKKMGYTWKEIVNMANARSMEIFHYFHAPSEQTGTCKQLLIYCNVLFRTMRTMIRS